MSSVGPLCLPADHCLTATGQCGPTSLLRVEERSPPGSPSVSGTSCNLDGELADRMGTTLPLIPAGEFQVESTPERIEQAPGAWSRLAGCGPTCQRDVIGRLPPANLPGSLLQPS